MLGIDSYHLSTLSLYLASSFPILLIERRVLSRSLQRERERSECFVALIQYSFCLMNMSRKERWYWLEKKSRKRKIKQLNISRRTVAVRSTPPLWWSSASLTCHLINQHNFHKNCMERKWKWSNSNSFDNSHSK